MIDNLISILNVFTVILCYNKTKDNTNNYKSINNDALKKNQLFKEKTIGNSTLRVIFLDDLEEVLKGFYEMSICYHYKKGLPKAYKAKDVISLVSSTNDNNVMIKYHCFDKY